MFIVATNVIASRLPERRPTGTPHSRAKKIQIETNILCLDSTCNLIPAIPYVLPDT